MFFTLVCVVLNGRAPVRKQSSLLCHLFLFFWDFLYVYVTRGPKWPYPLRGINMFKAIFVDVLKPCTSRCRKLHLSILTPLG